MDQFEPLGKKRKSQFETTEQTPEYHRYSVKTGIENAETLRYIGSNQEEVLDKYEDVTKNKLIRKDILVQLNHLKETSFVLSTEKGCASLHLDSMRCLFHV